MAESNNAADDAVRVIDVPEENRSFFAQQGNDDIQQQPQLDDVFRLMVGCMGAGFLWPAMSN